MHYAAMPGTMEWVWIALVVFVLFGARKLPELARAMGTSITQFKKGLKEGDEQEKLGSGSGDSTSKE